MGRALVFAYLCSAIVIAEDGYPPNYVGATLVQLNDNGAWSWFMDPRVIVNDGKLIVGSVRAIGSNQANVTDPRWGNVEISVYDLATAKVENVVLHPHLEQDDHDAPAFLVRKDGRYLAVYSKHTKERRMYYRISEPHNPVVWGPAMIADTPGEEKPVQGDNATYANLFRMPNGRIYNFIRAFHHEPNYMYSDDDGSTWKYGGHWLHGKGGYSPYLKYADDGNGTIHFISTEDHPRNFDNSLYHGYIRDGAMYTTDGTKVGVLSTSTETSVATWDFTTIYQGTPDSVAWMVDVELDATGRPYVLFSTQVDGRGLPPGQGGLDLRYHYARLGSEGWHEEEIAHAGRRLYSGEDDYSGLGALDPNNPDVVYISTDADPVTGTPLISSADNTRHYELFRGERHAGGTWTFAPFTRNSAFDNLRPIIPKWNDPRTAIVWMRGAYVHNQGEWYSAVVAAIVPARS
jgi:putative BNR repeat neuraminidase